MKNITKERLALLSEVVNELDAGSFIVLQFILTVVIWGLLNGFGFMLNTLPNWAVAVGAGGALCLMAASYLHKQPRLFLGPVSLIALLVVQLGLVEAWSSNSHQAANLGKSSIPSLAEVATCFSWLIVAALALGGLAVIVMRKEKKVRKFEQTKDNWPWV